MGYGIYGRGSYGNGFNGGRGYDGMDRMSRPPIRTSTSTRPRINRGPLPGYSDLRNQRDLETLANGIAQATQGAIALNLTFSRQSLYMTFATPSFHPQLGNIYAQYQENLGIVTSANLIGLDHITFSINTSKQDALHALKTIAQAKQPQDLQSLSNSYGFTIVFSSQILAEQKTNPGLVQIATETNPRTLEQIGQNALRQSKNDIYFATLRRRLELNPNETRLMRTLATNLLQQSTISAKETNEILALLNNIAKTSDSLSWLQNAYNNVAKQPNLPASIRELLEKLLQGSNQTATSRTIAHSFIDAKPPTIQASANSEGSTEILINAVGIIRKKINALKEELKQTRFPSRRATIEQELMQQATKLEGIVKQLEIDRKQNEALRASIDATIQTAKGLIASIKPKDEPTWHW